MLRRMTAFALCAALLICSAGCGAPGRTKEETLFNGVMGLTIHVPKDWYQVERSERNLTDTPEASSSLEDLDLEPYGDGGSYIGLITLQNKPLSSSGDHITIDFYAQEYDSVFPNREAYVEDYIYYMEYEDEELISQVQDREEITLGGGRFTRLTVSKTYIEGEEQYIEEHYLTRAGPLYLVAYINYWSDSPKAKEEARSALEKSFSLDTSVGEKWAWGRETAYYNGYLGITVTVEDNRFIKTVNTGNLTFDPKDSEDLDRMEKGGYNDGGYYIDLITLQNRSQVSDKDYAWFDLYAEGYPQLDNLEEYVTAMVEAFTTGDGVYDRVLTGRDTATLEGREYTRLSFTAKDSESGASFTEENYILKEKELYLVAYVAYKDSERSKADAMEMLGCFRFGLPPSSDGTASGRI